MTAFHCRAALLVLSALPLLVIGACQNLPRPSHENVTSTKAPKLRENPPIEVAVAPIENGAGESVPTDELRAAFHKNLVKQRFTPLALEFVDRNVDRNAVPAAYRPGASSEQAVLLIQVDRWDTSLWSTHNAISAKISARLADASDPGSADFWSGSLDERIEFGSESTHFSTESARLAWACDQIAQRMLEALPARQAHP